MKKWNWTEMLISVVLAELVGGLSALLAGNYSAFYKEVVQPPFSPPGAVFPVVWAILYAIMGISAYLIWREADFGMRRRRALTLYAAQLAVNFVWSILFVRFRLFAVSAVTAILLAVLVALMMIQFSKVKRTAAWINLPYLLWSIFAAYLAVGVWVLNR